MISHGDEIGNICGAEIDGFLASELLFGGAVNDEPAAVIGVSQLMEVVGRGVLTPAKEHELVIVGFVVSVFVVVFG